MEGKRGLDSIIGDILIKPSMTPDEIDERNKRYWESEKRKHEEEVKHLKGEEEYETLKIREIEIDPANRLFNRSEPDKQFLNMSAEGYQTLRIRKLTLDPKNKPLDIPEFGNLFLSITSEEREKNISKLWELEQKVIKELKQDDKNEAERKDMAKPEEEKEYEIIRIRKIKKKDTMEKTGDSPDYDQEFEIIRSRKFAPIVTAYTSGDYLFRNRMLNKEFVRKGPPQMYELNEYLASQRLEIENNYKIISEKFGAENQEQCDRIRDTRLEAFERLKEQMQSLYWRQFYKYSKIPRPKNMRFLHHRWMLEEVRDSLNRQKTKP